MVVVLPLAFRGWFSQESLAIFVGGSCQQGMLAGGRSTLGGGTGETRSYQYEKGDK